MERIKVLAIIARLMFAAESDGLACWLDSVTVPSGNLQGALMLCEGNGRFREFLILPSGRVISVTGRTS